MEVATRHSPVVLNFEVILRFLESLGTAALGSVSRRGGVVIHLRQAPDKSTQQLYIGNKRKASP
jgi:hypothetical protein